MSGQLKEVRNRIQSVQSTQQITKAMKMVSAAKLRHAQDAILQMRPYAKKLQGILTHIVSSLENDATSLALAEERPVQNVLIILITSDRGLAGAYNMNLIKLAKERIAQKYAKLNAEGHVTIWNIGKKGYESLNHSGGYKTVATYKDLLRNLNFESVQKAAQEAVTAFLDKQFDAVEIIYTEFKNAATIFLRDEAFLPIPKIEKDSTEPKQKETDFIFEPNKADLLKSLVPIILNTQLYKAVLDSNASEHGARMTAMDKASDNAAQILRSLKVSYNRARQAAITTELSEIVSGAAALEG